MWYAKNWYLLYLSSLHSAPDIRVRRKKARVTNTVIFYSLSRSWIFEAVTPFLQRHVFVGAVTTHLESAGPSTLSSFPFLLRVSASSHHPALTVTGMHCNDWRVIHGSSSPFAFSQNESASVQTYEHPPRVNSSFCNSICGSVSMVTAVSLVPLDVITYPAH